MASRTLSRRTFLRAATAAAIAPAIPSWGAVEPALKDIAANKGILFGSAIDWPDWPVFQDPAVGAAYARECAIFVIGYQLLWSQNEGIRDSFSFDKADRVVDFAEQHGAKVAGHPLIWHQFIPYWAEQAAAAGKAEEVLRKHVTDLVTHYKGKMHHWNVVNEGFDYQQNRADGLMPTPFATALGPRYLDVAFQAAGEADPNTPLVFNEVGIEQNYPDAERKRTHIIRMVEGFKKRGVPIHAIGIESHLRPDFPFSQSKFNRFLDQIAKLGLRIFVTELDVDDNKLPKATKARDAAVASTVKNYLDVVLSHMQCDTVLTWGLVDKYSWLNQPVPKMDKWDLRNSRKDGTPHRPLPLDDNLARKPMWDAMAAAFRTASAR